MDVFQRRAEAKNAVIEIEQRKRLHLKTIEQKEAAFANLRANTGDEARAAAASAFFRNEPACASIAALESEIRTLHEQLGFFDSEIKTRQKALNQLAGEHQLAVWARVKKSDDANKAEMADLLIRVVKCCEREIAHEDEARLADTTPPASFRPMRPNFIAGRLNDPNSFVSMWLNELKIYYPHVVVKVTK